MTSLLDPLAPETGRPTLTHPGPVARDRVVAVPTRLRAQEEKLPAGTPLLEALERLLRRCGGRAAAGELIGGELAAFSYFIPDVGPADGPVATFSDAHPGRAPGRLIRGGLTVGRRDGSVFAHSHALFVDADGVQRAGHLIPDSVVLGEGVTARVWAARDVAIEVRPDPETTMSLFVPRPVDDLEAPAPDSMASDGVDALVCRLRPNVDLVRTIEHLVDDAGWDGARISGQIGSLVGGSLAQADGSVVEVDGPATEVVLLDGDVRRADGRVRAAITAGLVDRHGTWHTGGLVRGHNPVAMTYELVLTRSDHPQTA